MRTGLFLLLFAFCPLAVAAEPDESLPVPADEFVYCTVCHGVQLMGNPIIKAPRLSGMDTWYVERQLMAFKNGWRGAHESDEIGMEMQPMAAVLSDEQIREAAEFVSKTRSPLPPVTVDGNVENGRARYMACAACHGIDGKGNAALGGPALTGQNDWYLVTQMENYRDGIRGSHPADVYGMQMRSAVQLLSDDQDIRDVVSYINTLNTNQGN